MTGDAKKEAVAINKSLTCLGDVIFARVSWDWLVLGCTTESTEILCTADHITLPPRMSKMHIYFYCCVCRPTKWSTCHTVTRSSRTPWRYLAAILCQDHLRPALSSYLISLYLVTATVGGRAVQGRACVVVRQHCDRISFSERVIP